MPLLILRYAMPLRYADFRPPPRYLADISMIRFSIISLLPYAIIDIFADISILLLMILLFFAMMLFHDAFRHDIITPCHDAIMLLMLSVFHIDTLLLLP